MAYRNSRIPVPDWKRRVELETAWGMIRQSTWGAMGGGTLPLYFDIDELFAADYRLKDKNEGNVLSRKALVRFILNDIEQLTREQGIDSLAFIDDGEMGPVGAQWLAITIAFELNSRLLLVRPWKELVSSRIKGKPPEPGERFLILTDVATTGGSIIDAAQVLDLYGASVAMAYAIVAHDDEKNFSKRAALLEAKNINFHHWKKASELKAIKEEGI